MKEKIKRKEIFWKIGWLVSLYAVYNNFIPVIHNEVLDIGAHLASIVFFIYLLFNWKKAWPWSDSMEENSQPLITSNTMKKKIKKEEIFWKIGWLVLLYAVYNNFGPVIHNEVLDVGAHLASIVFLIYLLFNFKKAWPWSDSMEENSQPLITSNTMKEKIKKEEIFLVYIWYTFWLLFLYTSLNDLIPPLEIKVLDTGAHLVGIVLLIYLFFNWKKFSKALRKIELIKN